VSGLTSDCCIQACSTRTLELEWNATDQWRGDVCASVNVSLDFCMLP
jgi:hypothetical protein